MADQVEEYALEELSGEFGKITKERWGTQLEGFSTDEDLTMKSMYLSRLEYSIDKDTDAMYYGLKEADSDYACAILELTLKMPETNMAGLRLLNINLEPQLDVENRHAEHLDTSKAIKIISECIINAFDLTDEFTASTFKIYGRTDRMQLILENVANDIENSKFSETLDTSIQGRWLLIEKFN